MWSLYSYLRYIMVKTLIFVIAAAIAYVECDEKYTTKYDNIDLDQILHTDRLLKSYVKCLMNEGPCTPDGAELKRVLIDAMESDCQKCSAKQKDNSDKPIYALADIEIYLDRNCIEEHVLTRITKSICKFHELQWLQ
ncbi:Ejaculatory bulb protein III [Carabus blaptoides fortunei]